MMGQQALPGGASLAHLPSLMRREVEAMSLFEALYIVHMQIMIVIAYLQYIESKNDGNKKK